MRYLMMSTKASLLTGYFFSGFPTAQALAVEKGWRSSYDEIMIWINAAILFLVLYKLLKNPIRDFIRGQKFDIEYDIEKVRKEKEKTVENVRESLKKLEEGKARFERMKERIIDEGEKKKQEIIEDAENQSHYMILDARKRMENQIQQSRATFKAEVVDAAIRLAQDRLPKTITEVDNRNFIDRYLEVIESE